MQALLPSSYTYTEVHYYFFFFYMYKYSLCLLKELLNDANCPTTLYLHFIIYLRNLH